MILPYNNRIYQNILKGGTGKVVSLHAMKRMEELQVELHLLLSSALDGGDWLTWRLGRFTAEEKAYGTEWIGDRGGAVGWGTALQVRRFAGSIPDGVIGIFHWHNPSGRTVALESTQPLTEMSTGNISWGVKAAGG